MEKRAAKKTVEKGRDMQMFPLGLLNVGEKAEVIEIRQGTARCACLSEHERPDRNVHVCRIEDMGLRTGREIEMLNSTGKGALLVKIDESRIAIGRAMAMKIMVRRTGQ